MLKFVAAAAVAALLAAPSAQAGVAVAVSSAPGAKAALKEMGAATSAKFRWGSFRAPKSKTLPRTVPAGYKYN
jgi:hypothetical protein